MDQGIRDRSAQHSFLRLRPERARGFCRGTCHSRPWHAQGADEDREVGMIIKAPTSNIQAPENFQTSISKAECRVFGFGAWFLKFLWSLDVETWSFRNVT